MCSDVYVFSQSVRLTITTQYRREMISQSIYDNVTTLANCPILRCPSGSIVRHRVKVITITKTK